METITRINGNGKPYTTELPLLIIQGGLNETAINHIKENTGLEFTKTHYGFTTQPISSMQIASLFMTYNFKTRYYNNWDLSNTIVLKHDHHVGFDVKSICYDCCEQNNINTNGMNSTDRLSC